MQGGGCASEVLSGAAPRDGCGEQAGRGRSRSYRRKGGCPGGKRGCEEEVLGRDQPGCESRKVVSR